MRIIFLFIDGIGIGSRDEKINPVYATKSKVLAGLIDKARFKVDASMGVKGLPQSATGQTAIFTGVNASMLMNRHISGQPTETLKNVIYKVNLYSELKKLGLTVTSANVYQDKYLANMLDEKDRKNRPSVTSVMGMAANIVFKTVSDFVENKGVYHDLTGEILKNSGYQVEAVLPDKTARNLYAISREYDFTLFEYFITDIAGHMAELTQAIDVIEKLDCFIATLLELINFEEDILIITSDHGNIEDISVNTHTTNLVPGIVLGEKADRIDFEISSLVDIMPYVIELFRREITKE